MYLKHRKRLSINDTNDGLQQIKDIKKLSTPFNYDVDNGVQSDLMNKSEANVEIKSTTKDTQLNTKIYILNSNNYKKLTLIYMESARYSQSMSCPTSLLNKQLKNYV